MLLWIHIIKFSNSRTRVSELERLKGQHGSRLISPAQRQALIQQQQNQQEPQQQPPTTQTTQSWSCKGSQKKFKLIVRIWKNCCIRVKPQNIIRSMIHRVLKIRRNTSAVFIYYEWDQVGPKNVFFFIYENIFLDDT